MDEIKQLTLPITGLTCACCAPIIESSIKKLTGIKNAIVNLPFEQVTVQFSPTQVSLADIVGQVTQAGYDVTTGKMDLLIQDLSNAEDASRLEKILANLKGVLKSSVSMDSRIARVIYVTTITSQSELLRAVKAAGFETGEQSVTAADAEARTKGNSHHQQQSTLASTWRFTLHFLEMLLAMEAGMGFFHLVLRLFPASSGYATALEPGTDLHAIAMAIFMTFPMLAWMVVRGHGWRHSLEMGVAMLAPVAAVALLCRLGADDYLPWLLEASGPAMYLGMIGYMLYRHDHFTARVGHSAQTTVLKSTKSNHGD